MNGPDSAAALLILTVLGMAGPATGIAQTARISEQVRTLETYPFSEPNRVPILASSDTARMARIPNRQGSRRSQISFHPIQLWA